MSANPHFIANEYLRAFDLKEIFARYAVYYSNLHYPSESLSSKSSHEITLKLEETMIEMTVLVLKMKASKSDTDKIKKAIPKPPALLHKVNEYRMAN
jgi:hypothetical protein